MCLHTASVQSTDGNKTGLILSPFLMSTIWFCILTEAFRSDHVVACSTAFRSATEKNEMGGYVTVPCSSKMTHVVAQRFGTNSSDVTRSVMTEHIRNNYSLKTHAL